MRNSHLARAVRFCSVVLCAGCATGGHSATAPVRVLVYNTDAGTDAKRVTNLDRVAQIVKDANAGIVLPQEVDSATRRSGGVDQVARLRGITGYYGVFGRAIDYDGGKYGIAILSRWPISPDTVIHLPVAEHDSQKSGWQDGFAQCGEGSGLSFPADVPVKRIDYLLFSRTTKCVSAKVLQTEASDHRPVLFEILPGR